MAECSITSVAVLNNPAPFTEPIVLEVQYECLCSLKEDLEWRINYIGSAESDEYDQVLDQALVGPVNQGTYKFRMEAPAPDPSRIPPSDLLGVTALLLTCSYKGKEFVRVGYYVNIEYTDPELLDPEKQPHQPVIAKLQRNIMADHPRVTKFPHDFDNEPAPMPDPEPEPEPEPEEELLEELDLADEGEEDSELAEEGDEPTGLEEDLGELENVNPNGGFGFGAAPSGGGGGKAAELQQQHQQQHAAAADDMEM